MGSHIVVVFILKLKLKLKGFIMKTALAISLDTKEFKVDMDTYSFPTTCRLDNLEKPPLSDCVSRYDVKVDTFVYGGISHMYALDEETRKLVTMYKTKAVDDVRAEYEVLFDKLHEQLRVTYKKLEYARMPWYKKLFT